MRTCLNCGSTITPINKNGSEKWYKYKDGYICHKCRSKLIDDPNNNPKNNPRRLMFEGKRISLKENPRTGICSWCERKIGMGIKRTQMHHRQYHEEDPLKDTVELCTLCHNITKSFRNEII